MPKKSLTIFTGKGGEPRVLTAKPSGNPATATNKGTGR